MTSSKLPKKKVMVTIQSKKRKKDVLTCPEDQGSSNTPKGGISSQRSFLCGSQPLNEAERDGIWFNIAFTCAPRAGQVLSPGAQRFRPCLNSSHTTPFRGITFSAPQQPQSLCYIALSQFLLVSKVCFTQTPVSEECSCAVTIYIIFILYIVYIFIYYIILNNKQLECRAIQNTASSINPSRH